MLDPSVLFSQPGPALLLPALEPEAWALLVPLLNQSSPLPPTASSVSWPCVYETPVLSLYPHNFLPLYSSANSLWRRKDNAPREATDGANPMQACLVSSRIPRVGWWCWIRTIRGKETPRKPRCTLEELCYWVDDMYTFGLRIS
jgi:hypothetical protein